MMSAVLCFIVCSSASFLFPTLLRPVEGLAAQPQDFDLQILTVSRNISEDSTHMWVTMNFTASRKPETRWTHAGPRAETVVIDDTHVSYGGGYGTATASFKSKIMVFLQIGYFDTQFLDIFIKWDVLNNINNITQTLNTLSTTVSPGYNLTYDSSDTLFQVTASVPRQIAEGFTWSYFIDEPENDYDVRMKVCYVDQRTGRVLSSVDHLDDPDTSAFLQTERIYGADGADWTLSFDTSSEDVSGYFQFFTLYNHVNHNNYDAEKFVVNIWETVNVYVHDDTTPGPFPDGYGYVRSSSGSTEWCSRNGWCSIYCYGYANDIVDVGISKNGEELDTVIKRVENSNHVTFNIKIDTSVDFAGTYVCRILTRDATEKTKTIYLNQRVNLDNNFIKTTEEFSTTLMTSPVTP